MYRMHAIYMYIYTYIYIYIHNRVPLSRNTTWYCAQYSSYWGKTHIGICVCYLIRTLTELQRHRILCMHIYIYVYIYIYTYTYIHIHIHCTVPADGLALLGVKTSTGTNSMSPCIYIYMHHILWYLFFYVIHIIYFANRCIFDTNLYFLIPILEENNLDLSCSGGYPQKTFIV